MGKLNIHIKATEQQTFHTQLEEETFHKIFEEETFHKIFEEETFNKVFEDEKKKKKIRTHSSDIHFDLALMLPCSFRVLPL